MGEAEGPSSAAVTQTQAGPFSLSQHPTGVWARDSAPWRQQVTRGKDLPGAELNPSSTGPSRVPWDRSLTRAMGLWSAFIV